MEDRGSGDFPRTHSQDAAKLGYRHAVSDPKASALSRIAIYSKHMLLEPDVVITALLGWVGKRHCLRREVSAPGGGWVVAPNAPNAECVCVASLDPQSAPISLYAAEDPSSEQGRV